MIDSSNLFEELIKRFTIKFGKLLIDGYHFKQRDPRKKSVSSPRLLPALGQTDETK
jgi:hypothetical protein